MKAIIDGIVLADSNDTKVIEGNHYFPPGSVKKEYFTESDTRYYPNTISDRAKPIENYVAFYKNKVQFE
ncbi:hypothetical protein HHX47_DHR4000413 [Lentinula edodes]|nr:hypothetical protein HHX47_DHR4000413 [Lentinula edodes]